MFGKNGHGEYSPRKNEEMNPKNMVATIKHGVVTV